MLNERIREVRMSQGKSQTALAQKIGVSKQCFSNWENGYIQPSVDMLIKLCNTLSVSADFLLGLTSDRRLNTEGLTAVQLEHVQALINDIVGIAD